VTAQSLLAGVEEASALAPDVCPTDTAAGCAARRERLLRLLPQRQFLDREGVEVAPAEIDARIAQMKRDPNPFGRHPPKPLLDVMTRECIPWEELRLMIRVDLGMRRWAERQWDRRWPSAAAWASRAAEQRTEFDRRYGRFRRLAFSLERWPAGARDEDEAMAALREQASRARERLDRGEDFDAVAAELRGPAAGAPGSGAGEVLPFTCLGDANVEALRGLAEGAASAPVQTRFAWIILRREPATDADVRQTLREEFILSVRSEKEKEIVSGARVEEGAPPGRSGEEEQR
jgi:hypothetical protein